MISDGNSDFRKEGKTLELTNMYINIKKLYLHIFFFIFSVSLTDMQIFKANIIYFIVGCTTI